MAQAPQPFQVRLAPDQLWQAINPWFANSSGDQFGLVNITLGHVDVSRLRQSDIEYYDRR